MNVSSVLNTTRPISLYEKEKDTRDTSFLDVLAQTTERTDDADLSELPASCNCELCKIDDSVSQNEDGETDEVGDDIIFDIFDHFEACLECEDREHCKHYLGMTGASEEEIEKADIIIKTPFDKYKDIAHEQLSQSLRTSIIYNYNLICPEIEKKPKRDK